jgi:hypothetical protein
MCFLGIHDVLLLNTNHVLEANMFFLYCRSPVAVNCSKDPMGEVNLLEFQQQYRHFTIDEMLEC